MAINDVSLSVQVKPGSMTTNFEKFKAAVAKELEENYKSVVVTDEHLQDAKKLRAKLSAARRDLKDTMRSAQEQNDEPLKVARQQAKELEALFDDAIRTLDDQIHEIEQRQRSEILEQNISFHKALLDQVETNREEIKAFAAGCKWIVKLEWQNKTYTQAKVRKDTWDAVQKINQALQLLTGEFRPQMLAQFKETGDLGEAQLLGTKLAKQKADYEASEAAKAGKPAPAEPTEDPGTAHEEVRAGWSTMDLAPDTPAEPPKTISLVAPAEFNRFPDSQKRCHADFRVQGMRYQLQWLMKACREVGITLTRIDK